MSPQLRLQRRALGTVRKSSVMSLAEFGFELGVVLPLSLSLLFCRSKIIVNIHATAHLYRR